jgi:hypothetical protein
MKHQYKFHVSMGKVRFENQRQQRTFEPLLTAKLQSSIVPTCRPWGFFTCDQELEGSDINFSKMFTQTGRKSILWCLWLKREIERERTYTSSSFSAAQAPATFERACVMDGGLFGCWALVCGDALVNKKGRGRETERAVSGRGPGMDMCMQKLQQTKRFGARKSFSELQGDLISGFPRDRCAIAGCGLVVYSYSIPCEQKGRAEREVE